MFDPHKRNRTDNPFEKHTVDGSNKSPQGFFVMTRYHGVVKGTGIVEVNPTRSMELPRPSRISGNYPKLMFCNPISFFGTKTKK